MKGQSEARENDELRKKKGKRLQERRSLNYTASLRGLFISLGCDPTTHGQGVVPITSQRSAIMPEYQARVSPPWDGDKRLVDSAWESASL